MKLCKTEEELVKYMWDIYPNDNQLELRTAMLKALNFLVGRYDQEEKEREQIREMIQKKMDENRLKFSGSTENKSETIMLCEHIETGAIGIIKNELKGNGKFPDQWGIYWIKKANSGKFGNHYYWNDKNLIKKK